MEKTNCKICTALGEEYEVEEQQFLPSEQSDDEPQKFPKEFNELKPISTDPDFEEFLQLESINFLKCPHCGTYYMYRKRIPGGSEDVMRTYVFQNLYRLTKEELRTNLETIIKRMNAILETEVERKYYEMSKESAKKVKASAKQIIETEYL